MVMVNHIVHAYIYANKQIYANKFRHSNTLPERLDRHMNLSKAILDGQLPCKAGQELHCPLLDL